MPNLALILFLPWFLILSVLFWLYPRQPRTTARTLFDTVTLLLAGGGSFYAMRWAYLSANTEVGMEWKQIFATLVAYGVFLGVMTIALIARFRMLRRAHVDASR